MKTRVIFTKIWKDGYFRALKDTEKIIFLYLFTNEYVNQLWLYECPDDVIAFESSTPIKTVQQVKIKFQTDKKFYSTKVMFI